MHKGRPLVTPMMVVTTTGYIVTIMGPYLANGRNNDASIVQHMWEKDVEGITDWLLQDDIFVVDRGFRVCSDFLNQCGIKCAAPAYLSKKEKQHSEKEANDSRLVTKVRWVVESANARLKTWKYIGNTVPNSQVPYIGDYVRIVAAVINKWRISLASTKPKTITTLDV